MRAFDFVMRSARGDIQATLTADDNTPTALLMQAVMTHQQLVPHFVELHANEASTLLMTTPSRQTIPPGMTVVFSDGVNINGPIHPSPIPNVPKEFDGVQLTYNLAVLVVYKVDPAIHTIARADDEEDDEWSEDTEY